MEIGIRSILEEVSYRGSYLTSQNGNSYWKTEDGRIAITPLEEVFILNGEKIQFEGFPKYRLPEKLSQKDKQIIGGIF